jgi:hypothetical protein
VGEKIVKLTLGIPAHLNTLICHAGRIDGRKRCPMAVQLLHLGLAAYRRKNPNAKQKG